MTKTVAQVRADPRAQAAWSLFDAKDWPWDAHMTAGVRYELGRAVAEDSLTRLTRLRGVSKGHTEVLLRIARSAGIRESA